LRSVRKTGTSGVVEKGGALTRVCLNRGGKRFDLQGQGGLAEQSGKNAFLKKEGEGQLARRSEEKAK